MGALIIKLCPTWVLTQGYNLYGGCYIDPLEILFEIKFLTCHDGIPLIWVQMQVCIVIIVQSIHHHSLEISMEVSWVQPIND